MRPANLCLYCRSGRYLCGHKPCPLLARLRIEGRVKQISQDLFGPAPSIFIGRDGWPRVFSGPLAALSDRPDLDRPESWFGMGYHQIIELRSQLLRGKERTDVRNPKEELYEIALANRPPDVEIRLKKKPYYRFSFSDIYQPMGPTAPLESFRLAENPRVSSKAERIVGEGLKAGEALWQLYRLGIEVSRLSVILSAGALGLEKRLVPTRWSITAVHQVLAGRLIRQIKLFRQVESFMLFSSEYLDNSFHILVMPGQWEFENFEAWAPGSLWARTAKKPEITCEYEPWQGRSSYAESQAGGYYASRLGVAEGLFRLKRQGRVVVFREISEGYIIPVGVWQVLENVRNAFRRGPERFSSLQEALEVLDRRLRLGLKPYLQKSRILGQRRLQEFG
ncbi:MAG: hypothetical protein DRP12_02430 [Candidatus Aenigmatarchaeota archaeon]|nr:MAG: hypothetical protein DRP12_02430 [Candidatus Aenigmarchaeota archaeon]